MRLDKFLCEVNIGSRSQVKQYIRKGNVWVNGQVVTKPEQHIDPNHDQVTVEGKLIQYNKYHYYMLNKPPGVVTAVHDARERTVIDLLDPTIVKGLFPVGRLDKDTEGLLLITDDGALAHQLTSPAHHVKKTYYAIIDGEVLPEHIQMFANGLDIGEKRLTKPAQLHILTSENHSKIEITITEGKFHQIKRMFQAIGMSVLYLKRISMGELTLDSKLELGEYRALTAKEIAQIGGSV